MNIFLPNIGVIAGGQRYHLQPKNLESEPNAVNFEAGEEGEIHEGTEEEVEDDGE